MRNLILSLIFAVLAPSAASAESVSDRIAAAAAEQTRVTRIYDPAYVRLAYPGGDVPPDRGVCTDVVIRALRAVGVDLQKEVHEDMRANFSAYPRHWGARRPDPNIDHRRVPNLETFFTRKGARLPSSRAYADFLPGDVVSWNLKSDGSYQGHIGVVSNVRTRSGRPLIVHNIGAGAKTEDVLFNWTMTGRFRPGRLVEPAD
ncbi:MAG: DUF1287 domain-containing protein [Parvularculaceae bacterium]|nr:DUF1287 domain-containing protein [Parvularculaceae bacterium]